MGLRNWIRGRRDSDSEAGAIKSYGWERVGFVLSQHWVGLIGLNLMYLLCCLPVLTIPAATCAMHRVILNLVRETSFESMIPAFFREFRVDFLRRTAFGLLMLIAPFSLAFYPALFGLEGGTVAVTGIALVVYFCVSKYFYPLLVLLDVSVWQNFKNACILAVTEWRTTLQLLFTAGIIDLMLLIFTLQAIPLFVIILCAFNCLLGCAFVNRPFGKYFEK